LRGPKAEASVAIFPLREAGRVPALAEPAFGARPALPRRAMSQRQWLVVAPLALAASLAFPGFSRSARTRAPKGRTLGRGGAPILN
jgi:hypothetical protein